MLSLGQGRFEQSLVRDLSGPEPGFANRHELDRAARLEGIVFGHVGQLLEELTDFGIHGGRSALAMRIMCWPGYDTGYSQIL